MEDIKLWHGDCLELMQDIEAGSIDAIICDPPYGTTACKWDSVIPFGAMWEQLNRVIKPNGAIVLFGSEPFSSALRMSNIKNYKYDWIWDKLVGKSGAISKRQPMRQYENIIIFINGGSFYYPIMEERNPKNIRVSGNGKKDSITGIKKIPGLKSGKMKFPTNILKYGAQSKGLNSKHRQHPCQKPVLLMEYLIKTYTNKGETVLDFTMGSGSTLVACQNTNRNGIAIEQLDKYFNIAQERTTANRERLSQLLF